MAQIERLEPPDFGESPLRSKSHSSAFLIGRDSRGYWVARDQARLCGGVFVSRSEAVRFAMQENGRHSRAVIMVPGILELTPDFWPHGPATSRFQEQDLKRAANR